MNGDSYWGPESAFQDMSYGSNAVYVNCSHEGDGDQVNGPSFEFTNSAAYYAGSKGGIAGGARPSTMPRARATWINCRSTTTSKGKGTQVNGSYICYVQNTDPRDR